MAGKGIRFQGTDHEEPKPLIEVIEGKPMIQLVVECLTPEIEHQFIFICRREHDEQYQLDQLFAKITAKYQKVLVDEVTDGPACSVLLAREWINNDQPMMTACADDYVNTDINQFLSTSSKNQADGTIMTYRNRTSAGSSARVDQNGLIKQVAEKKIISDITTVGIYYFSKGRYFVEATEQMIAKDARANGEFYVSPVYNEMIEKGYTIKPYQIKPEDMHTMGTPEGLKIFQKKLQTTPEIFVIR